jgi:hypothetical protein
METWFKEKLCITAVNRSQQASLVISSKQHKNERLAIKIKNVHSLTT